MKQVFRDGPFLAAATDALFQGSPGNHPLLSAWRNRADWLAGRLVITPHKAFYSDHAAIEMRRNAAVTIRLLFDEGRLRNRIVA